MFHTGRYGEPEFVNPIRNNIVYLDKNSFLVGAPIIGRISDWTVIKWRKERGGVWYPEDRLRASMVPLAVLVPLSVVVYGLVNQFVDGPVGLFLSLVCLFVNGLGVSLL